MSGVVILVVVLAALFVWPGAIEKRSETGMTVVSYRPLWLVLLAPVESVKPVPET